MTQNVMKLEKIDALLETLNKKPTVNTISYFAKVFRTAIMQETK
jgi:hypothetical protein